MFMYNACFFLYCGVLLLSENGVDVFFSMQGSSKQVGGEEEVLGVKENKKEMAAAFLLDEEDSSIMRSPPYFLR